MTTLKANNVTPEYISIGNEINDGVAGVTRGEEYYQLLQKGYEAVKAVSPETKVVIHLTVPNQQFYEGWIDDARNMVSTMTLLVHPCIHSGPTCLLVKWQTL